MKRGQDRGKRVSRECTGITGFQSYLLSKQISALKIEEIEERLMKRQ